MKAKKQQSFITKLLFVINNIAAILLLLSYLSIFISPDKIWPFAFLGISYPFLLILNCIFILFWILKKNKYFLLSLIVILIGFYPLNNTIQLFPKKINKNEDKIKVLSYNVRLFDVYKYKRTDKNRFLDRNKILDLIKSENPDIMCLQEFFYDKSRKFKTLDTIINLIDAKNFHTAYTADSGARYYYNGAATFSKYPIINKGKVNFGSPFNNICIYTDIVKGIDTIRIYNIHLESIRFSKEDEMFYEEIVNQDEQSEIKRGTRKILSKLKRAFINRASQSRILAEHILNSPYPVMVCGDFNDTPNSYCYHTVSRNLKDAFKESGKGLGTSYNGTFPSFRIDYILHSNTFAAFDFEVIDAGYSDHFPIKANIVINEK